MIDKQAALELIQALPDGVTTEDILAELYFKHQVDQGIADLQSGRVLTHEEMTLALPDEITSRTPEEFRREVRLFAAARLFEAGLVSSVRAAELAGISRILLPA